MATFPVQEYSNFSLIHCFTIFKYKITFIMYEEYMNYDSKMYQFNTLGMNVPYPGCNELGRHFHLTISGHIFYSLPSSGRNCVCSFYSNDSK